MKHLQSIEVWARYHRDEETRTLARRAFDRCDDDGVASDDVVAMTELQTQFEWERQRPRRRKKR
ncbi:hypothetical protein GCM10011341_07570 [Frigidibacter albus]|nr:hypothetical protein GCM10011341_07570 [Frigidibacter albus]